jgi:ribosome-binding protein aMBF1 (putative translation factor)
VRAKKSKIQMAGVTMQTSEEWFKEKLDSFRDDPEFRLERIVLDLTEEICVAMERENISRAMLAQILNVSPAAVTKFLRGTANFTLKTLLAFGDALDLDLQVKFERREAKGLSEIQSENVAAVTVPVQDETAAYSEYPTVPEIFKKPALDAANTDYLNAANG